MNAMCFSYQKGITLSILYSVDSVIPFRLTEQTVAPIDNDLLYSHARIGKKGNGFSV